MISDTGATSHIEITTSAPGLLVMTQFQERTPQPRDVIARLQCSRGNHGLRMSSEYQANPVSEIILFKQENDL
jgi:hypothetical protein